MSSDALMDLGIQLKYAQDALAEIRRKLLEREVWESDMVEKIDAMNVRFDGFIQTQGQFAFGLGEINQLRASEIGGLKLDVQELNRSLGELSDAFSKHLLNGIT